MLEAADHPRVALRRARALPSPIAFVRRFDWVLMAAAAALVAYGLWVVDGITRFDVPGDENHFLTRQAVAAAIGLCGLIAASLVPLDRVRPYWKVLYGATLALMVVVFVAADTIRGSRRWIDIGVIQFQPSELGKILFVLALAGFAVERASRVMRWKTIFQALGLGAVPILLVFRQPDLGTALVYAAALFAVLFFVGVRWRQLLTLFLAAVVVTLSVLWWLPALGLEVLKPYQTERLTVLVNPEHDPSGATWNVNQSITAIGSGGLSGRGIVEASQTRLDYLPEHATDFAFASLGEQRGFVGCAILLLLYLLVVWRGLRVVTVAGDLYAAVVAGGLVFAFLFQVFVNVGMTMGVAPVTGIPLPFIAVGGTSLVANLVLIGILQGIHARGNLAGRPSP